MKQPFFKYLGIVVVLLTISNCAKRGRPSGGIKDTTAPVMLNAQPENKSIHFGAKKIRIDFDEYIKVKDINTQLIISPPLKTKPIIYPQGSASKFITIKLLDTLQTNTTYTFNFGNSIVDNNEENPYKQFMYVFSTGDYLDSLAIQGNIKDALKKEADENVTIMLYDAASYYDSIVYKEKPKYITNTLDSLIFKIPHIKKGSYKIIALKDKNNNNLYEPKSDKIGFVEGLVTVPNDSINYSIALFKEQLPYKLLRSKEVSKGKIIFPFEGISKKMKVKLITKTPSDFRQFQSIEKGKDTMNYWFSEIKKDSLQFEITNGKEIDKVTVKLRSKVKDTLSISKLSKNTLHYVKDTFTLSSSLPIHKINASKIKITDKDTIDVAFKTLVTKDKRRLQLVFDKQQQQSYKIQLLPKAIEGFFYTSNDTLKYRTRTLSQEDYGNIELTLKNKKKGAVIVSLLDKKGEILENKYVTTKKVVTFALLEPNTYTIRLVYDADKNNVWTTGSFLKNKQAEQVIYFTKSIEVRANWDIKEIFNLK